MPSPPALPLERTQLLGSLAAWGEKLGRFKAVQANPLIKPCSELCLRPLYPLNVVAAEEEEAGGCFGIALPRASLCFSIVNHPYPSLVGIVTSRQTTHPFGASDLLFTIYNCRAAWGLLDYFF